MNCSQWLHQCVKTLLCCCAAWYLRCFFCKKALSFTTRIKTRIHKDCKRPTGIQKKRQCVQTQPSADLSKHYPLCWNLIQPNGGVRECPTFSTSDTHFCSQEKKGERSYKGKLITKKENRWKVTQLHTSQSTIPLRQAPKRSFQRF